MTARLEQILGNLDREGVTEVMIESGRPVQVREEGVYVPVSGKAVPRDELEALFKNTDIELPTAEGSQPAVEVTVGARYLKVRTSKRGNQIVVRLERSKNPPPPRTKTGPRTTAARTTTRERTPAAARTATRNKRQTTAPRAKGQTAAPRSKRQTATPPIGANELRPPAKPTRETEPTAEPAPASDGLSIDIELERRSPEPPPKTSGASRIRLGGKEIDLEVPDFEVDIELPPPAEKPVQPSEKPVQRETAQVLPPIPPRVSPLPGRAGRPTSQPLPSREARPPVSGLAAARSETTDLGGSTFELGDLSLDDLVPPSGPAAAASLAAASLAAASLAAAPALAPATAPRAETPTRFADLIAAARARGATDVHIATGRPVFARLAGELVPLDAGAGPLEDADEMLQSLLDSEQATRLAQTGYVDLAVELPPGRLRANICRYQGGLRGAFRIAHPSPATLHELGLPRELSKVVAHHQGLVVVAGPSGHGKTTTLAALVDVVNASKPHHIITVEDPIEIVYPRKAAVVSQREAGRHTRSFATALKASLREDPDVIVIGELRDRQTVEIALTAAETGHLVIATMSTPSAARTIDRLIDVFPAEEQQQVRASVAGALRAIVAQRLLPAIGGGVVPAIELVTGVLPLAVLIRDDKLFQLPNLMQRGKAYGMIRIEDSIAELQRAGKISDQTAKRALA